MTDWREDLKQVLLRAGLKDKPITFLFSDVQVRIVLSTIVRNNSKCIDNENCLIENLELYMTLH